METIDSSNKKLSYSIITEQEQSLEDRKEKVLNIRRKLRKGKYNLNEGLTIAIDKLIEEILVEDSEKLTDLAVSKGVFK